MFESIEILENDVKKLFHYFDCNSFKLIADKTENIIFRSTESTDLSITIDWQKITEKTSKIHLYCNWYKNSPFNPRLSFT